MLAQHLRFACCLVLCTLLRFAQRSRSNLPRLACKRACRLALRRLSGAGNNPMVGMTVAVAVAIEEASK
ncbi:MAG: hypothetical protein E7585_01500 [Ruminococcaceae bacterium]|nr:hypothetical protein [Oscillospiraceae bacterium]